MATNPLVLLVLVASLSYVAGDCTFPVALDGQDFYIGYATTFGEAILMAFRGDQMIRKETEELARPPVQKENWTCVDLLEEGDNVFFTRRGGLANLDCIQLVKGSDDTYLQRLTQTSDESAEECRDKITVDPEIDVQWFIKNQISPQALGTDCPFTGTYQLTYEKAPGSKECEGDQTSTVTFSSSEIVFDSCMTDEHSFESPLTDSEMLCKGRVKASDIGFDTADGDVLLLANFDAGDVGVVQFHCVRYMEGDNGEIYMSLDVSDEFGVGCRSSQSYESATRMEYIALGLVALCHPVCGDDEICVIDQGTPSCTNPCDPDPCDNGGTCSPDAGADNLYTCECEIGWTGTNCSMDDPCVPLPCANSGECQMTSAPYYECQCSGGWQGANCTDDPCDSNPCQNNGTCSLSAEMQDDGGYECECLEEWRGKNCHKDKDDDLDKTLLIVLLIALVVVVIGILCLVCCFCARRRREDKKVRDFEKMQTANSTATNSTVITERNAFKSGPASDNGSLVWNSDHGDTMNSDRGIITMNRGDTIVATF